MNGTCENRNIEIDIHLIEENTHTQKRGGSFDVTIGNTYVTENGHKIPYLIQCIRKSCEIQKTGNETGAKNIIYEIEFTFLLMLSVLVVYFREHRTCIHPVRATNK